MKTTKASKMEIMLIDDEQDFLDTLSMSLKRQGHSVTAANDGEMAWKIIKEGKIRFDVVISDIKMSPVDGIELLQRIRGDNNDVPVLLMTGHGDLAHSIKAIKLGANDFILKPFSLQYMKSILAKLQADIITLEERQNFIAQMSEEIHLVFPSNYTMVPSVNSILHQQYMHNCEMNDISSHLIDLCVNEAILNSVVHGNLEVESELKEESWEAFQTKLDERSADEQFKNRKVKVDFTQNPEEIRFDIEDEGNGFDYRKHLESLENAGADLISFGRGVALIQSIMDEVYWNEKGTKITFIKKFAKQEGSEEE